MATTTNTVSSNSFGFASPKPPVPQATCNICERLLYAFEEILVCRVCNGSYHWRCVKPETVSHYGEHGNYVCAQCNHGGATTTTHLSHRTTNGGIKIKSTDSVETDYREFVNVPSKASSGDTNVVNTIRYFEDKRQQAHTHKAAEIDGYLPSQTNGTGHDHHNSQYNDDSVTTRTIQQQQNGIDSDDENETSAMFQANYLYTPLKENAALKNNRTTYENATNGYQNSSSNNVDRQATSRYGGGLRYSSHGYDPTVTRLVEAPSSAASHFASPTVDNLSIHNRQHHFVSTTNLNVAEKSSHRQQQSSLVHSTPYLSQIRDSDSPTFKPQHTDRHSTVGSDSGIVIVNPASRQQQQKQGDENQFVEKKLTNLVQKLGKQLENDAQKINEKLELKLKNLEDMIHQQTYIIRRQDEVIERLKSKILKIETERDHFRDRLSVHEKREHDENRPFTNTGPNRLNNQESNNVRDHQTNRKTSDASTTDSSRPSTKKPAPRLDQQRSTTNDENKSTIAKLIQSNPVNRERRGSDSSSAPSMVGRLVASVPVTEPSHASSRLDDIIHQPHTKEITNPPASNYSLAQVRHQDRPHLDEPTSMEQHQVVNSIHHADDDDEDDDDGDDDDDDVGEIQITRPKLLSSSSSSSDSVVKPAAPFNPSPPLDTTITSQNRNPNIHRSLETLQTTYQANQGLKQTNKTGSLEFGSTPVPHDDQGSIYITPVEAIHPANQTNTFIKGWLRKQNRDSFFKRIERYYCVLSKDAILLHKHETDRRPHKAVNLRGAKVHYYDDVKFGPSLELTWSGRRNAPKHYHLYAPNPQEAEQWVNGIQATILSLENKNQWQQYRMNT